MDKPTKKLEEITFDNIPEHLRNRTLKDLEIRNSFDEAVEYLDYNYPDLIIVDFYLDKRKTAVDFINFV